MIAKNVFQLMEIWSKMSEEPFAVQTSFHGIEQNFLVTYNETVFTDCHHHWVGSAVISVDCPSMIYKALRDCF